MRLSRSAILSNRRKNQRVSKVKQKHKRLDAICEKTYTQNRVRIESPKLSEFNGDASEVRRSCRVRRAPLVLDASPLPTKKRKISEGSGDGSSKRVGERGRDLVGLKTESPCSTRRDLEEEESVEWKSRLRARDRNVTFGTGNSSSPRSKRNLFGHSNGLKEQLDPVDRHLDDKKGGLVGETLRVVRSKRSARTKASNVLSNGYENIDLENNDKEEEDTSEVQAAKHKNKDSLLEEGVIDNNAVELVEQGNDVLISFKSNISNIEQSVEHNRQMEQLEYEEREGQSFHQEVAGSSANHVGDSTIHTNHLQDENSKKVGEDKYSPAHRQHKPRIKKGRCCGLCGGGTDGKPPKKLVHDEIGSDNEAYSGSSSSEEPTYDIWDGFGDEPGWLGQLLGPINDRYGIAGIWVHQHCAVWSPEVYFAGLGCLKNVRSALCRGKVLKCSRCGRRGATIGCRVDRCPKTYHLPCARANGCIFDHRKFLIACTDHRHLFQPHGSKLFDRLKKIKAKKMKSEMRKLSNDAWRKDHEAEEKWLENCGEDEEFLKRESKRLHRDLFRIAPEYIGGSKKSDNEIPFQGWESVGGLQDVIQSLKEVVILPLLYPEFFNNIGLTPPRGVLLHGYPGTGKTLVVRALIGSCARGDRRIAYFARKGADCLGKYVGDAERQLRLLFQVAEKSQPSIIFFDEIDGLAPSRTRQQDQTHNSVVSTLLALLDGLKSRGSVVVIGATNRPDAIDPALRRPGRFDREIYFPLPSVNDREAILSLHTQKWPNPISGSLLKLIARRTVGFAGADLQALCTQTAIIALKRRCPWDKLLLAAEDKAYKRPVLPTFSVEERDWLEALSNAPPPCSRREAGMAANDIVSSPLPVHLFPCMLQPLSKLLVSLYLDEHIFLPGPLSKAAETIKNVIVSVMDGKKENSDCWWSHVQDFLKEADVASDVESNLLRANHLVGDSTFGGFDASDDDTNDGCVKFGPSRVHNGFLRNNLLHGVSHSSGKKPGFCVLISGSPRSGQRHLASCILHGFVGNVVLQKVDLATMSQEGGGDMVRGLTQILVRCANVGSCMIFMPRIDLWALETCHQVDEEENCFSTKGVKSQEPVLSASDLWKSFVEQAESIFISSSLMILATTEVPFESLPVKIKDFFGKNKQNLSPSNHTGSTIPRFSVNLDGNFNRDMVIASAAARLSNDIARYFVQLIHHKTHIHETSFDPNKSFNTIYADAVKVNPNTDSSIKYTSKNQNSSLPTPNRKDEKGKSNLMLAISTFGYQILQYPHFAELCWVTSKLKEGPFAEINGPWKGWPFNSCIVRPSEWSVNVAGASGSGNIKSKEKYGLVRGLIAVGLSAYRGVYSSVREVAAEVRKVLELLTLQINAKVEGGKDRYQFVRLLSQVAYLEDMVNSWAYTLQSLETVPKLNEGKTSKNNLVQCDDCVNKTSQLEHTEESTEQFDNQAINGLDPKEGDGCTMHTGQAASVADGLKPTMPAHWSGSASSKDQPDAHLVNEPNGLVLEPSTLKNSATSNGFCEESVAFPNDGPKEVNNSISNGKNNVDPTTPTDVCLYQFCLKCISNLESVMQKALITQWDIKSNILKIEDIHDEITSLSLNLYTSVREFCHDKNLQVDNIISFFGACECEHSGRKRVPVATDDYSRYGSELIYKNGVLAALDPETDLSFHCKFQKICLCSLIEYIVMMTKQPSG